MLEGKKEGVAFDRIAGLKTKAIECSIQEAAEKAIEGLFRMNLNEFSAKGLYQVAWFSKHGAAFFQVHDAVRYLLSEHGGW